MRKKHRRYNKKRSFVLVYAVMILCITVMSVIGTPANRSFVPFSNYALAEGSLTDPVETEETRLEVSVPEEETVDAAAEGEPLPGAEAEEGPETAENTEEPFETVGPTEAAAIPETGVTAENPEGSAPKTTEENAEKALEENLEEPLQENTEEMAEAPTDETDELPEGETEGATDAGEVPDEELTTEPPAGIAADTEDLTEELPEESSGEEPAEGETSEEPSEASPEELTGEPEETTGQELSEEGPSEVSPIPATEEATEAPAEESPIPATEEATEAPAEESPTPATEEATEAPAEESPIPATEEATETPAEASPIPATEEATEAPAEASPASVTEEATEAPANETPASVEEAPASAMKMALQRPMMMLAAPPAGTPTPTPAPDYVSDAQLATNSIQAAINAALETAGSTERATIQIKAGNYESDIEIKLENHPANFVLELVAEDAGTDYKSSLGGVNFAGNILIENVDVLLAGIYLALDKKVSITDSHTEILGTAQDDTVNVDLKYKGSVDIHTGDGDDDITINVTTDAGDLSVSAGAGEDTAEINKGGSSGTGRSRDDNTATVDMGSGADMVTIDVGVADTYKEIIIVNQNTADIGSNAVSFTGTLASTSKSKGAAVSGDEKALTFRNAKGNTFTVKNAGPKPAHYTDTLTNKPSVILNNGNLKAAGGVLTYTGTAEAFTDYVLTIDPDSIALLAVNGGGLLSRLLIDAGEFGSFISTDPVRVHNVKAPGMNIGVYGNEIEVDGAVYGANINIEASDGTTKKRGTNNGTVGSAVEDFFASLINVSHSAKVTVDQNAILAAREDLTLSAAVTQRPGLSSIPAVNNNTGIVDVKVGSAKVDIAGKLYAGYDEDLKETGDGSIRAFAKILAPLAKTQDAEAAKESDTSNQKESNSIVPLSVLVAVEDAKINIRGTAELAARGSVVAHARSAVTSDTHATTQSYLPLVLDTAIIVNDAHIKVDGAAITGATGNVNLSSKGYLRSDVLASKGASDQSVTGGFFGVSIGIQDVSTTLKENTVITAGGDAKVSSRADADARTAAVAAYATSAAKKKKNTTSDDLTIILTTMWGVVNEKLNLTGLLTDKALGLITGFLFADEKEVKMSDSSTVEGYGTASVKKNKTGVGGTVTVNVLPKDGRDVETIRYRYLEKGASEYKYQDVDLSKAKKSDTVYEFKMPDSDIIVFVTYKSAPGKTYEANGGNSDPFARGTGGEIEMTDLSGIVDKATDAAAEDTGSAGSAGVATENSLAEDALTLQFGPFVEDDHGAILTAADDGTGKSLSKLDAGSSVELTVNPAGGYALKKDSLTLTYTRNDGVTVRDFLTADSNGKYFLVMPTDAKAGTAVTVAAEFEPSSEEPVKNTASAQAVGALAAGVLENSNNTVIDLGAGKITAGGKTEFVADGYTINDVYADASRVTKSAVEAAKAAADAEEKARYYASYAEGGEYAVKLKEVTGGTVTSDLSDGVVVFTAASTDPQTAAECLYFYTDDLGETKTVLLQPDADGKFRLDLKKLSVKGGTNVEVTFTFPDSIATDTAGESFVEKCGNPVQLIAKGYGKIEQEDYGYDGSYKLNLKPGAGYKVKFITVGYMDAAGSLKSMPVTVTANEMDYTLIPENLPGGCKAGQPITVTVEYDAYKRGITVQDGTTVTGGKLTADLTEAKEGDTVTGSVTPEDGYKVREVAYTYVDEKGLTQVEFADVDGDRYTFTMPGMKYGLVYKLEIKTTFVKKDVEILVEGAGIMAEQSRADRKEATAITADDPNMKLTDVVIKAYDASGNELTGVTAEYKDGKLTVPDNDRIATLKLSAKTTEKALTVTAEQPAAEQGTLEISAERAEPGETVTVTFTEKNGYAVRDGSVKAIIKGGVETSVKATRNPDGTYSFTVPKDCASGSVEIRYELTKDAQAKTTADLYVGTGIAVAVTGGENQVSLRSGSVTAGKDFTVQSVSNNAGSGAVAKSGYSEARVGIGGAIAVNISDFTSEALIHNKAAIDIRGGFIKVKATNTATFTTTGDSSVKSDKSNTGVGTGIAVAVNSSDVYAMVQDGTAVNIGHAVTGMDILANQQLTDNVTAKAGSAGNTAVTPSVAVDIFASETAAVFGAVLGNEIDISNDSGTAISMAVINAANKAVHALTADASAAGKGVGLGGAFGIAIVTDRAQAALKKSLKANGIYVGSDAQSTVKLTVNAGAAGGAEGSKKDDGSKGSADAKADELAKNAASLSSGKNSNTGALQIGNKLNGRQQAQTGEGSVAGAAALALNIQDNASSAVLSGGMFEAFGLEGYQEDLKLLTIKKELFKRDLNGTVRVSGINRTEAQVKANASATKSHYGVGAAVSVSIVDLTNTARIVDSGIVADKLDVQAIMPTVLVAGMVSEPTQDKVKETVNTVAGTVITKIMNTLGVPDWLGKEQIETLVSDLASEFSLNFLTESGVDKIFGIDDIKGQMKDNYDDLKASIPDEILAMFRLVLLDQLGEEKGGKAYGAISKDLKKQIAEASEGFSLNLDSDEVSGIRNDLLTALVTFLTESLVTGEAKTETLTKPLFDSIYKVFTQAYTDKDFMEKIQSALKGYDPSLAGIAGSVFDAFKKRVPDMVANCVVTMAKPVDLPKLLKYLNSGMKETLEKNIRIALSKAGIKIAENTIKSLDEKYDLVLLPENQGQMNILRTEAISGAGAADMGVAGSVALLVLNEDILAEIGNTDASTINVSGNMTVKAESTRRVTTTATASADGSGEANTNDEAAGGANDAGSGKAGDLQLEGDYNYITIAGGPGYTVEVDNETKKARIIVEEGYTAPMTVPYTYTDKDGNEKQSAIMLGDNNTFTLPAKKSDMPEDGMITIKPAMTETLKALADPLISGADPASGADAAVKLPNRDGDDVSKARPGETVQISTAIVGGKYVDRVSYTYEFVNDAGEMETKTENVSAIAWTNDQERVYSFRMPEGNITAINVYYADGEDETGNTNSKGDSVGVGASFAMVYGDTSAEAALKSKGSVTVDGNLAVTATADSKMKNSSVAGTDPAALKKQEQVTGISVDASVALSLLDSGAKAVYAVDAASGVTGKVTVDAEETTVNLTQASGFAMGKSTAVGAAAAINIGENSAETSVTGGTLKVGSEVTVRSGEYSEDTTRATATALGADVQRLLNKYSDKLEASKKNANALLDGSLFSAGADQNKAKKNENNATASLINGRLNAGAKDGQTVANNNNSVSTNILATQNVSTSGTSDADKAAASAAGETKGATGLRDGVSVTGGNTKESKFQVAAAAAVNVATHNAATLSAIQLLHEDTVSILSSSVTNTRTLGTAAAISREVGANSISAGVAVSVNNSKAVTEVGGEVTGDKGDVTVSSDISQNLSGSYAGRMAVQALSGAVSGKDSGASVAGAVTVLVSGATAETRVNRDLSGDNVRVTSTDKSRLTSRAGGLSLSTGSTVGVGAAFSSVFSNDTVNTRVADNVEINARSAEIAARKIEVTHDDYRSGLDMTTLMTDSSKLTPEQRKNVETGIIDVHKSRGELTYTLDVNLSSDKLISVIDLANVLSGVNYYSEAIAGSIVTGESSASVAGSFAVTYTDNLVQTLIGNGVRINTSGNAAVEAKNDNTYRTVAGAVSAGTSKAGVGLTLGYLQNNDAVKAILGESVTVQAGNDYTQEVSRKVDAGVYTAAASVGTGKSVANVGGAINVILLNGAAENTVDSRNRITAGGTLKQETGSDLDLMLISVDAQATGGKVAAGGTVAVVVNNSRIATDVGWGAQLESAGDMIISAAEKAQLISGIASVSAAKGTAGVAGSVNILVSSSETAVNIANSTTAQSTQGSLLIGAESDTWLLNAGLAAAGSTGVAVGGTVAAEVLKRQALVNIESARLKAAENVEIRSEIKDFNIMAQLSGSVSTGTAGVSGTIPVIVSKNTGRVNLGERTGVFAEKAADIGAHYSARIYGLGGALSAAGGTAAVGATVQTVVLNNTVETLLKNATQVSAGSGVSSGGRKGLYIGADADETMVFVAAGGAGAGTAAVSGAIGTLVVKDQVRTGIEGARITETAADQMTVEAVGNTHIVNVSGGLGIAGTAAVGASAVTQILDKTVATSVVNSTLTAAGEMALRAKAEDGLELIAVSAGVAGTAAVEVGAVMNLYENDVTVAVSGSQLSAGKGLSVTADKTVDTDNTAVAVAGSGTAAVTPVAVVTLLGGKTGVELNENRISATGDLIARATTAVTADPTVAGVGLAGAADVSGAVSVLISEAETSAVVKAGKNMSVTANNVTVDARDSFTSSGMSGVLAGGGTAAVAVNALVTVLKNTVKSEVTDPYGGSDSLTAGGNIQVTAGSARDVVNVGSTLGVAGTAGVSVAVTVLASGGKLTQDAADALATGGGNSTTFDSNIFTGGAFARTGNSYTVDYETSMRRSTDETLTGNGVKDSKMKVGSGSSFDAVTGYRASESAYAGESVENRTIGSRGRDLNNASALGSGSGETREDTVLAVLGANARAGKDIQVKAESSTLADSVTASLGGGMAGVGFGVNVVVLNTGVEALTEKKNVLNAGGDITVNAYSGSDEIDDASDGSSVTAALNTLLSSSGLKRDGRSLRVVSAAAGAGGVAVAVPVAVLRLNNATSARMLSEVKNAKNINIASVTDYPLTLAATVGLGAGLTGFSGSVAVVSAEGVSEALYGQNYADSDYSANRTNISVTNKSRVDGTAVAAALGAGGFSMNAAVAVAANRTQDSATLAGGKIKGAGNVNVGSTDTTTAHAYTLGVGVGLTSVTLSGAVSVASPENISKIATGTELAGANVVDITAKGTGSSLAKALTAGAGITSVSGSVLLSFNDSVNRAELAGASVKNAAALRINAILTADAETDSTAVSAGAIAAGINVSYTDMKAENTATVDLGNATVNAEQLDLKASLTSHANAAAVVASLNGLSAGFNTAIVDARGFNFARILSELGTPGESSINRINITAEGVSTVNALVNSRNLSLAKAGASYVLALQRVEQTAGINDPNIRLKGVRGLEITSDLNKNVSDAVMSRIISNDSAIMNLNVSVAEAYGRSQNKAILKANTVQADPAAVKVMARGKSGTKALVTNGNNSALAATVFQNLAYSQDLIQAQVTGLKELTASSLDVNVDYSFAADSSLQPTVGSVSLASAMSNRAIAKVASKALASVSDNGKIQLGSGALNITANGGITAKAEVKISSGKVSVGSVSLASNQASSDITATVGAEMTNSGTVTAGADSVVSSVLRELTSAATVQGYNSKVRVSFVSGDEHKASAAMHANNTVTLRNTDFTGRGLTVRADNGKASSTATTLNDTSSASVSFASVGNMRANAGINAGALVNIAGNILKVGDLNVSASADVSSAAYGASPKTISAVKYNASYMNSNIGASDKRQAVAVTLTGNTVDASGKFSLAARNTGNIVSDLKNSRVSGLSLAQLGKGSLSTASYYSTDISLTGSNTVNANYVSIDLYDSEKAQSDADSGKSLSGIDLSTIYGNNRINVANTILLGKGTVLNANRDLKITANNAAEMATATSSSSKALLASGNTVQATSTLARTLTLTAEEGTVLTADYGDLTIDLVNGMNDAVKSTTYAEATALFSGFSKASATASLTNTTDVLLNGAILQNPFGTMTINATAASSGQTSASAQGGGFVGKPTASAYVGVTERSRIQAIGSELTAKYLNVLANIPMAYYLATSSGKASGVGSYVNSWGTVDIAADAVIELDQSVLTGHEEMVLLSDADPEGYIKANSGGRTAGVYASGESVAKVDGHLIGTVKVTGSELKGTEITVVREALNQSKIVRDASMKKKGLFGSPDKLRKGTVKTENGSENITFNDSAITLGGGAAGIAVEVYNENGAVLTRSYGLSGRRGGELQSSGKVQITDLASFEAGTLIVLDGSRVTDMHGTQIIENRFVPSFTVTNLSDRDIILGKILESSGFLPKHMTVLGAKNYNEARGSAGDVTLDVTTAKGKDVYLSDIIDAPSATASFVWTGPRGNLYNIGGSEAQILNFKRYGNYSLGESVKAPKIFVNQLKTVNGKDLGTTADPLEALLFGDGVMALNLDNTNVDLKITPAEEVVSKSSALTSLNQKNVALTEQVNFNLGKVRATGHCNIDLEEGVVYLHTQDPIQVYDIPVTVRYMDVAHTLSELFAQYGKNVIETQYPSSHNGLYLNKIAGDVFVVTDGAQTKLDSVLLATYDAYYRGTDEYGVAMYEMPDGTVLWYDSEGTLIRMQLMQAMTDGSVQGVVYELGNTRISKNGTYSGATHYKGSVEGVGTFVLDVASQPSDNPFAAEDYTLTLNPEITYTTDMKNVSSLFACNMLDQGLVQIAYRDDEGNYVYSTVYDRHANDRNTENNTTVCKTYFGVTEQQAIAALASDEWDPVYVWFEKDNIPDLSQLRKTGEGESVYYTMNSSLIRIDRDIYTAEEGATDSKYVFVLDADENGNNRTTLEFRKNGSAYDAYYQGNLVGRYDPSATDNRVAIPGGDLYTEVPYTIRTVNGQPTLYMMDMKADEYVSGSVKLEQDPATGKYVLYLMDPGSDLNAEGSNGTLTVTTASAGKPVVLTLNDVYTERPVVNEYLRNEVNITEDLAARIDNGNVYNTILRDLAYYREGVTAPVVIRESNAGIYNFLAENVAVGNTVMGNPWSGSNGTDQFYTNWNRQIGEMYAGSSASGAVPYYWMNGDTLVYDTLVADLYANSAKGFSIQSNILGAYNYVQNGVSTPMTVSVDASGKMTFSKDGTVVATREVAPDGTVYFTAEGVKVGSDRSYSIVSPGKQSLITRMLVPTKNRSMVYVPSNSIIADTVNITAKNTNLMGATLKSADDAHIRANSVTLICNGIYDNDHQILTVGALDDDMLTLNVFADGDVNLMSRAGVNLLGSVCGTNVNLGFSGSVFGNSACSIDAKNLNLNAAGRIGTGRNALRIYVSGMVNVNDGELGLGRNNVWYTNLYKDDNKSASDHRKDRRLEGYLPVYELNELESLFMTAVTVLFRNIDLPAARNERVRAARELLTGPELLVMKHVAENSRTLNGNLTFIHVNDLGEAENGEALTGTFVLADAIHNKAADREGRTVWYAYYHLGQLMTGCASVEDGLFTIRFEGKAEDYTGNKGYIPFVMFDGERLEEVCQLFETYLERI